MSADYWFPNESFDCLQVRFFFLKVQGIRGHLGVTVISLKGYKGLCWADDYTPLPKEFSLQIATWHNKLIIFQTAFLQCFFFTSGELWVGNGIWTIEILRPFYKERTPTHDFHQGARSVEYNAVWLHSSLSPNKLLALSCNGIPQIYANEGALISQC